MTNLTEIINAALSKETLVRRQAEAALEGLMTSDLAGFLKNLCYEISEDSNPKQNRHLAGLILKNTLCGEDKNATDGVTRKRWQSLGIEQRKELRKEILKVLGSKFPIARKVAALIIAKIAAIELPLREWDELLPLLLKTLKDITLNNVAVSLWESTMLCLAYITEEVNADFLEPHTANILESVKFGIDHNDPAININSLKTLFHTLCFTTANFEHENQRRLIVEEMIIKGCKTENPRVQLHGFLCLCELVPYHYDHMFSFMQSIFDLTKVGMTCGMPEIGKQSTEFWALVCDEELERERRIKANEKPNLPSREYGKRAAQHLLPVLISNIVQKKEEYDTDEWTIQKAAASCLTLFAALIKNEVLQHVLPFVKAQVENTDWKIREAAILCFGLILGGPDPDTLTPLCKQMFPVIVKNLRHPNIHVKDTSVWVLGQMFKMVPGVLSTQESLDKTLEILLQALNESAQIAFHVCWAIQNIANLASPQKDNQRSKATPISPYLSKLILGLLRRADKQDSSQNHLLNCCYEAIVSIIESSGTEDRKLLMEVLGEMMKRLGNLVSKASSDKDVHHMNNIRGIVSVIGTVILTVGSDGFKDAEAEKRADLIMQQLMRVLRADDCHVQEEVILAIIPLANALGENFTRYINSPNPEMNLVRLVLKNIEKPAVLPKLTEVSVSLLGTIASSCGNTITPLCDDLVSYLIQSMVDNELAIWVKPVIISCIGDIALAVNGNFTRYLECVMGLLFQAGGNSVVTDDEDVLDSIQRVRECVLEACSSIVQSLRTEDVGAQLLEYVNGCILLIEGVLQDTNHTLTIRHNSLNLVFDIVRVLAKKNLKVDLCNYPVVKTLVEVCKSDPVCADTLELLKDELNGA